MSCAQHTAKHKGYSCVAQLAERSTVNRMVAGSSPAAGAIKPLVIQWLFVLYITTRNHKQNLNCLALISVANINTLAYYINKLRIQIR